MPRFLSVHTFPPGSFTPERIEEIAARGQNDSVVRGYRSFHSPTEGQIVWILEAPSKEAVLDFCQRMGASCRCRDAARVRRPCRGDPAR